MSISFDNKLKKHYYYILYYYILHYYILYYILFVKGKRIHYICLSVNPDLPLFVYVS